MASETEVLNIALGKIGAERITGIDDGTVGANWCKTFYPELRRKILRMHHWNFAEGRVELALDVETPAFGYAFQYTLPADFLKIREFYGTPVIMPNEAGVFTNQMAFGYRLVGNKKLLTNSGQALIVYTRDEVNPDLWDPLFAEVLAVWLASDLALAMNKDNAKADILLKQAMGLILPLATAADGQEGTVTPYVVDDLIWGRR